MQCGALPYRVELAQGAFFGVGLHGKVCAGLSRKVENDDA